MVGAPGGGFYVSSAFTGVLAEYDDSGRFVRTLVTPPAGEQLGAEPYSTGAPFGMGVDPTTGSLYWADLAIGITDSIGPIDGAGTVRRITFDADGNPRPVETLDEGLDFPDGIGIYVPARRLSGRPTLDFERARTPTVGAQVAATLAVPPPEEIAVQLGIHVPNFNIVGGTPAIAPELVRVAEAAEAAGATWLSVMDHYFQMDAMAPAEHPMLEGYTTLGFWAAHTSSIRLGLLVTGVTYRHPGLLAKIVSTLDVLSGGRAALGIGAAWYEREHRGLGVPFPPVSERFERLEEALQICLQMWDPTNNGRYDGRHYQLAETLCSPAAAQPAPPADHDRR